MTDASLEIVVYQASDVPRELRTQVRALQEQAWPEDGSSRTSDDEPGSVHDPALDPVAMLLVREGRVLAALDILTKSIVHGGARYEASGLSTVVTDEAERGKGHGRRLVETARERIEGSGVDLGIFTCDSPLRAFYERCGWATLPGTVLIGGTPDDPFPSDRFDKVTMGAFFSLRARRAAGTFIHARVELYPGEIDRLW